MKIMTVILVDSEILKRDTLFCKKKCCCLILLVDLKQKYDYLQSECSLTDSRHSTFPRCHHIVMIWINSLKSINI